VRPRVGLDAVKKEKSLTFAENRIPIFLVVIPTELLGRLETIITFKGTINIISVNCILIYSILLAFYPVGTVGSFPRGKAAGT
jgi:hypothetical protein